MINHKDKFIYIHIPKTGGSSVEKCLLENEGIEVMPSLRFMPKDIREKYVIGSFGGNHHFPLHKFEKEFQEQYFCFTFVRNPFSRAVSEFLWLKKECKITFETFKTFAQQGSPIPWHEQTQYSFINKNIDFVGRFENLQEDFGIVCNKIGISSLELPHTNKTKHKHYTEYYDEETKQIVAEKYAKDIEYFGYKFGQ